MRPRLTLRVLVVALALGAAGNSGPASGAPAETDRRVAVEALDVSGGRERPCGEVDTTGPFVRGGCRAVAYDFGAALSIRTPFGAMAFGDCTMTLDVNIDTDGRIWLDRIRIGGGSPCNDIRPCAPQAVLDRMDDPYDGLPLRKAFTWRGQIEPAEDDRFRARIGVCFDSCVGRYRGPASFDLVQGEQGWLLRASDAGVGKGGLSIDGDWQLTPPNGLELRAP